MRTQHEEEREGILSLQKYVKYKSRGQAVVQSAKALTHE